MCLRRVVSFLSQVTYYFSHIQFCDGYYAQLSSGSKEVGPALPDSHPCQAGLPGATLPQAHETRERESELCTMLHEDSMPYMYLLYVYTYSNVYPVYLYMELAAYNCIIPGKCLLLVNAPTPVFLDSG